MDKDMNQIKTDFLTDLSYKLRTPLTLTGGPIAEVPSTETLGDSARRHLEMVKCNAERMLALVNKNDNSEQGRRYLHKLRIHT